MEFEDDAYVLSARAHGETGAIVELLTQDRGKFAAHVSGAASRRMKPFLQAGAKVIARYRARMSDQLGAASLEPIGEGPASLFDEPLALSGLSAAAAVAAGALPEREAHPGAFHALEALIAALAIPEIWPAVYEKAFAKWKTNDATDEPNYGPIAGGWPVQATTELTNLTGVTKTCSALSEDDIWTAVRSNCLSYRTFNPMTAWTFCQTPSPVEYSGTGIVGYHAYTILGWAYVNNTKYIVLRNPWGHNSPVINSLPGNWSAYDTSFWRSVPLNAGGVFAIPAGTFKKYYWQFGWAS